MAKHSARIIDLARRGAEQRLRELKAEITALKKIFPHLTYGSAVSPAMPDSADDAPVRKRNLSAAARKRISDAQKKRWAAHRKNNAK